ncbi:ATP-binding protein [Actinacidiphila glaucinigra]|uniref:ATP-binding protein n=1 Tax=Actinacidiphila glaucinigra TaxID=235986 RepID=UPI0037B05810
MTATTPRIPPTVATFVQLLPHSRHGARLARQTAAARLRSWPVPSAIAGRAEQVVAELAANAALHGRVRGRSFRIALALDSAAGTLRIEVSDARGGDLPVPCSVPAAEDESGRGLILVAAFADRWGTQRYPPSGKTVWAELDAR